MNSPDMYKEIVNSISAHVAVLDYTGCIIETNHAWQNYGKRNGLEEGYDFIGVNYLAQCTPPSSNEPENEPNELTTIAQGIRDVLAGKIAEFSAHYPCHSPDEKRWFIIRAVPVQHSTPAKVIITHENITKIMLMQEELIQKELELNNEKSRLTETNTALRVLLQQHGEERQKIEETVYANVSQLVLPYFEKLQSKKLGESQRLLLEIAETNLKEIVSPFLHTLSSLGLSLTPQEIEVAHLVRSGRASKEIADILGISVSGVDFHRKKIRRKLGLNGTTTNLRSYLMTLEK